MNRLTFHDRRRPDRPKNGDRRTCPGCGQPGCEFNACYRFGDGTIPIWVCDVPACSYREVLRRPLSLGTPSSQATVSEAKEVQARARRTIMRSAARAARARRHIADSTTRLFKSR